MNDKKWERDLDAVERDANRSSRSFRVHSGSDVNLASGWLSLAIFIGSLGVFVLGVQMFAEGAGDFFSTGNDIANFVSGSLALFIVSLIGVIISVAVAGAEFATKQGTIGSGLVLGVILAPLLYILLQMFIDVPAIPFEELFDNGKSSWPQ